MLRRNGILFLLIALCIMSAVFLANGETRCFAMPSALAEEEGGMVLLDIKMTVQPDALVEPGDVTLAFTITNESDTDAQNLYLSSLDGLLSEPLGRIAAGESRTFVRTHSVSKSELDSGEIVYILSHNDPIRDDGKINYTVRAAISQSEVNAQAEFTRSFSSKTAAEGDTITIRYCIRNTGNVVLNSLRVRDELGDFTGRIDRLEVGESRTLISRVTITESCVSSATLSYGVEAYEDEAGSISLEDVSIEVVQPDLESRFSVDYSAFSANTAEVVLTLSNNGSMAYHDLRIIDDIYGGVIADGIELPVGSDSVEISASCPVRGDASFRWRIIGDDLDLATDTLVLKACQSENIASVTAWVEAVTPRIRRAGDVSLRIHIENTGDADIVNLALSEAEEGEVRKFAVIPASGTIEREITMNIQQDSTLQFSLRFTDADGWQRTLECPPVTVEIAPDGALPLGQSSGFIEFNGASIKIGGSSLFAVLLIVGAAVLAVLIVLLLIASRRARLEKQLRMAEVRRKKREAAAKNAQDRKRKNRT